MSDPTLFTYKMRKATRKIHSISDALVNAKLAMALNSDAVWAEGLYRFYIIFKFLEEAMLKKKDENLGKMFVKGMARTEAFENDLTYYFGSDWKKTYELKGDTDKYYFHLDTLFYKDPDLLMAYVYHLYMGLLSGGQILRKKRELKRKIFPVNEKVNGEAVTDFGDLNISELKCELRSVMNSIAETLDEETQLKIIEEGNKVFQFNNMIIRSIDSTNRVLKKRALALLLLLAIICILYFFLLAYN